MIEFEQRSAPDQAGRTIYYDFDDIFWTDGGTRWHAGTLAHNGQLQWRMTVPDSVAREIREQAERLTSERSQPTAD